jgi:hypothetical protein
MFANDKAILTCALTGVLTDPKQHPVPVTPEQMAASAREAYDAGAAIMHVHLRQQAPGQGHLPSWDPEVAAGIVDAIRAACPGVIINLTTGVIGKDISGPAACLRRVRPEIAACNAGTLNYLKLRDDGKWAWPPMVFDNPVEKVQAFLDVMGGTGTRPEFECFDVGIVRSVAMYRKAAMASTRRPRRVQLRDGRGLWHAGRRRPAATAAALDRARLALAGHADRTRRDLAAAPARRRTRRHAAHRTGRHVLPARRQPRRRQRRADRGPRRLRPRGRARSRQSGRTVSKPASRKCRRDTSCRNR